MINDKYPLKTNITVLSADSTKKFTLGLPVYTYDGVALYPIINNTKGRYPVPMTEELVVGEYYTSLGIFGEYLKWSVEINEFGEFVLFNGIQSKGLLRRGGDDRKCWVITGVIHKSL